MEYLDFLEIKNNMEAVKAAFAALMNTDTLVSRPGAKQWLFFTTCAERLFAGTDLTEDAGKLSKVTAAQYKFEVERKLRMYYLRPGKKHDFVFTLVHVNQLPAFGLSREKYPACAGYAVLVRDVRAGEGCIIHCRRELIAYLEKVVTEGAAAEFRAYSALPDIDQEALAQWFVQDSPAMNQILHVLQGVARRGWNIQNPMNPSTYRLLSVVVKKVLNDEAEVATREYWYLRWWDQYQKKYTYPYRETNQQLYILRNVSGGWKVFQNMRPAPRSSQPLRWNRRK